MKLATLQSAAVLMLMLAACWQPTVVDASALQAIPEVYPDSNGVTSVTLIVDAARVTVDSGVTFSTRAYYVNGTASVHGPTLVLQAGGHLNITLINRLADDSANDASRAMNTFRHANTTNIHTHGLHVDPAVDSIFRIASPGTTLNYYIEIPSDHAPGMHWYHSHAHGGSTMHVMGGLLGAMYVRAQTRDSIPAAISSLTTHRIVMQMLNFAPETVSGAVSQACSPSYSNPYNPFKTFAFSELETAYGSLIATNPVYSTTDRLLFTINGQYQPTLTMQPGESRLFQVVYGAASKMPAMSFPTACTVQQLAFDGVYFTAPRTVTHIQFVTGTRAEFVMSCTAGTHIVQTYVNGNVNNVRTSGNGGTTLFTLSVSGTTLASASLPSTLSITRPSYLTDLTNVTAPDHSYQLSMAQGGAGDCLFWLGAGTNCTPNGDNGPGGGNGPTSTTCTSTHFAGQKFTNDSTKYKISMRVGQTAEWMIFAGGDNAHPVHIHVNHFQIAGWLGTDSVVSHWVKVGDWRDTMAIATSGIKIRFAAHYYPGETVIHCHELHHEDHGLMDTFLIMPALTTTSAATATPPPGVTTPSPSAGGIGMTTAPSNSNAGDGLIGHRGALFAVSAALMMLAALF